MPAMEPNAVEPEEGSPTGDARMMQLAGGATILAGVIAFVGSLLHWARLAYPTASKGVVTATVGHDRVGLYLGAFLVVAGIVVLISRTPQTRRSWGASSAVSGLLIAAFAIYDWVTIKSQAVNSLAAATPAGNPREAAFVKALIRQGVAVGRIRVSLRPGIYLALAAAVVSVAGGTLLLLISRRQAVAPAADSAPAVREEERDQLADQGKLPPDQGP